MRKLLKAIMKVVMSESASDYKKISPYSEAALHKYFPSCKARTTTLLCLQDLFNKEQLIQQTLVSFSSMKNSMFPVSCPSSSYLLHF